MSRENPIWRVPPIQAELHLLGYEIAESTVTKYRVRSRKPPSQNWKSFLLNHVGQIVAVRRHQSLEKNSPVPREIEPPAKGKIISVPQHKRAKIHLATKR